MPVKSKQALSRPAIARAWGTSPQYVSKIRGQCLRSGDPMPEFRTPKEAADWYATRRQRSVTGDQGGGYSGSSAPAGGDSSLEIPTLDEMMSQLQTGSFDEMMVEHAERVPVAAYNLYLQAVRAGNDAQVSQRIKNWGEATKQAAAVREKFVELQEKTGQLLPMDIMLDVVGEVLQAIVYALDTMGAVYAAKANPENPERAKSVLNAAADAIKKRILESEDRVRDEVFSRREFVESKTSEDAS
jgi:hypothetical protein